SWTYSWRTGSKTCGFFSKSARRQASPGGFSAVQLVSFLFSLIVECAIRGGSIPLRIALTGGVTLTKVREAGYGPDNIGTG
ncbi:MAG TPA: hypothetical protein VNB93_04540, partial [Rubrobacter sp.]|nr:hypothetical protein [Rubrobacter sp.]